MLNYCFDIFAFQEIPYPKQQDKLEKYQEFCEKVGISFTRKQKGQRGETKAQLWQKIQDHKENTPCEVKC